MSDDFEDRREAITTIGREAGPEATGLLVALMDRSRVETDDILASVLEMERADRDRWKARALDAERHLRAVEARIMGLLAYPHPSWDPDDGGM